MNTNDDKKNTTEETISRLPEENLNDVQGGADCFHQFVRATDKKIAAERAKNKAKKAAKAHDTGASGSW